MARVACLVMLRKNERALTPRCLGYHAALFGAENLYVFDNGSDDPEVLAALQRFEGLGAHVERRINAVDDLKREGSVLGNLIERLDRDAAYDLCLPLDGDAFLVARAGQGYTADPAMIHACLDRLCGQQHILRVTVALSNLLGMPDMFRPVACSKPVYPRGALRHTDHDRLADPAGGSDPPYSGCDLVHACFHNRPYEAQVASARETLRAVLSDAQIDDHESLRGFRGPGHHLVSDIVDGEAAYYSRFRDADGAVAFPELAVRFAAIGLDAPFSTFRIPPRSPVTAEPPHLVIDEASTARVRGWAMDPRTPDRPLRLRFLIDGVRVWEGACDGMRPDVRAAGHVADRVGFDFRPETRTPGRHILIVEDQWGGRLRMQVGAEGRLEVPLAASETVAAPVAIYSHIDSFRHGRVQGWVLRTVVTPEGPRRLGCCTVALAHEGRIVMQVVADTARADVAAAMQGEPRCGFLIEIPRALLTRGRSAAFRLFVMPERHELTGSPCIIAPGVVHAHG